MSKMNVGIVFVGLVLLTVGCHSEFSIRPMNVVLNVGDDVTLSCATTTNAKVSWSLDRITDFIYSGYGIDERFPRHSTSTGRDLVIRSVQLADAGRYFCSESEEVTTAELVVLNSEPVIRSNVSSDGQVTEHDVIEFVCYVNYSGHYAPSTQWTQIKRNGERVTITNKQPYRVIDDRLLVNTTGEMSDSKFEAFVFFSSDKKDKSVTATNVPGYNKTTIWNSPITVNYGPNSLAIKQPGTQSNKVILRCTSEGHPSMIYTWRNNTDVFLTGQDLNICLYRTVPLSVIECTATNTKTNRTAHVSLNQQTSLTQLQKSIKSFCDTNYLVTVAYVVCASALFLILCTFVIAFFILRKGDGCTRTRPNRPDIVHNVPEAPARPDENHVDANDFENSLEANAGANQPAGDADDSSESDRDSAIIRQVQEAHDYYNAASMYNVRNANIVALPTKVNGSQNRPLPQPQPQAQQPQQQQQQQQRPRNAAFDAGEYADIDHRAKHYLGTSPVHNV